MNRTTKKFKLPHCGLEVEIYDWMTAGEAMEVAKQEDGQKFLIETLVLSIDGVKENIYTEVLNLSLKDYKVLDNELSELIKDMSDEEEKKN